MVTSSRSESFNEDTFVIFDPSGETLTLKAQYLGFGPLIRGDSEGFPCLVVLERTQWNEKVFEYGDPIIPDPRSVILNSTGKVIFTPRPNFLDLPEFAQSWLNANPDWPDMLMRELDK